MSKDMKIDVNDLYDAIIIGGGPSGLSAAIYLARAKYRVLVMEKEKFGGQITITSEIINYPGVESTSGKALTDKMRIQAENFGAEFVIENAIELDISGENKSEIKTIRTESGKDYKTLGIVLAVGASPRKIGFKGEKEFQGRGVAYCATCDGEFFTGREILVIGGGFAAVEEGIFLTKYASKVTMIVREETFTCAAGVSDKLKSFPEIEVHFNTEVEQAGGDSVLSYAKLRNNKTGEVWTYKAKDGGNIGIFVFAGYAPATVWLKNFVELNEQGYIVTDVNKKTSVDGVYAAGDVCIKNLRQVVTAVSDGATAATSLEHHISECRERLKLPKAKNPGVQRKRDTTSHNSSPQDDSFVNADIKSQLMDVFSRFEKKVTLVSVLNDKGASLELESFSKEFEGFHEKLEIMTQYSDEEAPYLDIRTESKSRGIRYYSVPGGHEFNSFIMALYNCSGEGQHLEERTVQKIHNIKNKHLLQVMATLSCTNCPEVVMGTQRIAALNDKIEAWMYDLSKFPQFKEQYNIMAVPCLIIDRTHVYFGKQTIDNIVDLICKTE